MKCFWILQLIIFGICNSNLEICALITITLNIFQDYKPFFERHALNSAYPAYKAPPGTQHYGYQYPQYPQQYQQ